MCKLRTFLSFMRFCITHAFRALRTFFRQGHHPPPLQVRRCPYAYASVSSHRSCPPIKKSCCTQDMTAFHSITKYPGGILFWTWKAGGIFKHYVMIIVSVCQTQNKRNVSKCFIGFTVQWNKTFLFFCVWQTDATRKTDIFCIHYI